MQHDFIPQRSCKTQLLDMLSMWTEILEKRDSLDVWIFAKYYIPFQVYYKLIYPYSFHRALLQCMVASITVSYIRDRKQHVASYW